MVLSSSKTKNNFVAMLVCHQEFESSAVVQEAEVEVGLVKLVIESYRISYYYYYYVPSTPANLIKKVKIFMRVLYTKVRVKK